MTRPLTLATLLLASLPFGRAENPVYTTPAKEITVKVSIMALSTAVHQQFAGNQDTYLADLALKDGHQTARLIDLYSGNGSPIRRSILTDRKLLVMHLKRKPGCDIAASAFFLDRGDRNLFDQGARTALTSIPATDKIPCYMVDHDQTKLAKK